jgi:hypothetical protein
VEEDSVVVVSVVVLAVADTPAAEVVAAEAELASVEPPASADARDSIIAEACVSLIRASGNLRAPGSFVLRLIDRPPWREQIAG